MRARSSLRHCAAMALVALMACTAAPAAAEGALVGPTAIPPRPRAALLAAVTQARRLDPGAFARVQALRAEIATRDARIRGLARSVAPGLEELGARALWPALAELGLAVPGRRGMSETTLRGWHSDLLAAVGAIRDPRARPVLEAILDGPSGDFAVLSAAARALGAFGDDDAMNKLIALSHTTGRKRLPSLAGMGPCRREAVAVRLAEAMAAAADDREAAVMARALGEGGSAQAWRSSSRTGGHEQGPTRLVAAQALVDGFVAYADADLRAALSRQLLVVDEPTTLALIEQAARTVDDDTEAALAELAQRFAATPPR